MRGAPKGNQNRKGKVNKRSVEIAERLESMGCDPIEGMARIALDCETAFYSKLKELAQGEDIDIPGLYKDLGLAGQMYKELAQYVAPKRKAIEMNVTGKMSLEQMLTSLDEQSPR